MRRSRHAALLGALLIVGGTTTSCRFIAGPESLQPARCLQGVDLHQLVQTVGLPQAQPGSWLVQGRETARLDQVFDLEYETTLMVDEPAALVDALCHELQSQLSSRCQVQDFWPGIEHCAAAVGSHRDAITGPDGTYTQRGVQGRINLFASPQPGGKVKLVLTGSEWTS